MFFSKFILLVTEFRSTPDNDTSYQQMANKTNFHKQDHIFNGFDIKYHRETLEEGKNTSLIIQNRKN